MGWLLLVAAVFAVLAMSAAGRSLIGWLSGAFKPLIGVFMYLVSAHYTIARHMLVSRSIIYPSMFRKTVHRDD